jgi:hypothetical protein
MVTAKGCPASQTPGVWSDVTPPTMKVSGGSVNGPMTVGVDRVRPNEVYVHVIDDGTWKSVDCGLTWKKVSTGMNGNRMDSGSPWYAAIDTNPRRDPATPPTLYVARGYGAGGIWKSTNGGVDWAPVWNNNIFAPDGVTNISKDVGSDIHTVIIPDDLGPDHVLATLHGYFGTGNNNGIFETKDGGNKWIVRKSATFNFQPHADVLFAYDRNTWIVSHGAAYPNSNIFRTTDSGETWSLVASTVHNIGRAFAITGSTIYAGTDYNGGVWRSTDKGVTWKMLPTPRAQIGWVGLTATRVYAGSGYTGTVPHVLHASLDNDAMWADDGALPGAQNTGTGANPPGVLFDGSHYVIISAEGKAGLRRYVEP